MCASPRTLTQEERMGGVTPRQSRPTCCRDIGAALRTGARQVDTGTIRGTVKDPSGALLPGATVTIIHEGQAVTLPTVTRDDGTYIFTPIRTGAYTHCVDARKKKNLTAGGSRTFTVAGSGETVPYHFFGTDRRFANFQRVIAFESTAESRYNGITAEINRRFANRLQFRAAYTLGKVEDTVPDATAVAPGNAGDDVKYASDPANLDADRTVGNNDQRHRFVLSAVYRPSSRSIRELRARSRLAAQLNLIWEAFNLPKWVLIKMGADYVTETYPLAPCDSVPDRPWCRHYGTTRSDSGRPLSRGTGVSARITASATAARHDRGKLLEVLCIRSRRRRPPRASSPAAGRRRGHHDHHPARHRRCWGA
jgi:hypothetical protein